MPKLPRDVDAAFVYLHPCQVVEADHVRLVDRQRKVVEVERHPALPPADPTQRQTVTHSAPELHARLAEERPQGKPPAALQILERVESAERKLPTLVKPGQAAHRSYVARLDDDWSERD